MSRVLLVELNLLLHVIFNGVELVTKAEVLLNATHGILCRLSVFLLLLPDRRSNGVDAHTLPGGADS